MPSWAHWVASGALVAVAALGVVVLALLRRERTLAVGLADRERRLAVVEALSHEWIWQATPSLQLTSSNAAVTALLGYRPDELTGTSLLACVTADDADAARALTSGAGWADVELGFRHADGHQVSLLGSAVPVHDEDGRVTGFCGSWRATPGEPDVRRRLSAITHRVRRVLEDPAALQVALQPVVELAGGTWHGVEALARFPDGQPPDRWFADAHEIGAGLQLELRALEAALATAGELPPYVQLSVNVSPALVLDPAFRALLDRAGDLRERLVVEITEHAAVTRYEDIRAALLPHREHGLRLAVDDTGAGYASFTHVLRLRPDVIKLDRSLLAGIDADAARRAFVTAIVLLALELGAAVTAEGIETVAELETLRTLGVDHVQGFLLARPTADRGSWRAWAARDWLVHAGLSNPGSGSPVAYRERTA
jgi:PAS domain S-box-containing protein